jgi:cytochrome c-type biogenesis protein CcmH/NrfG
MVEGRNAHHALNLDPNFVLAQFWRGCAYREKKMYLQAVQTFARARQLSGDNPAMRLAYGHA